MRRFSFLAAFFAVSLFSISAFAQNEYAISDAFVRGSPSKTTAAYMTVTNPSDKDNTLIAAQADWAERVELHNVSKDDKGVMKMFQVESIALPAKGKMVLQPGSYHIMIFGVKEPLKENEYKSITLKFSDGQSVTQDFIVKPMTFQGAKHGKKQDAKKDSAAQHDHHGHHNHDADHDADMHHHDH